MSTQERNIASRLITAVVCGLFLVSAACASPYDDALAIYMTGDFATANAKLQTLAAAGNADAEALLAEIYWFGQGVPIDLPAAARLAAAAAAGGSSDGEELLGLAYFSGRGRPRDLKTAFVLLRHAAAEHNSRAELFLYRAFVAHAGAPVDQAAALNDLKDAAASGLYEAQLLYAGVLEYGRYGVEKNPSESMRLMTLSADQRYVPAEISLASYYFGAPGFPHDPIMAAAWAIVASNADCGLAKRIIEPLYTRFLTPIERGAAQSLADEWEERHPPHHSLDVDLNTRMYCASDLPKSPA